MTFYFDLNQALTSAELRAVVEATMTSEFGAILTDAGLAKCTDCLVAEEAKRFIKVGLTKLEDGSAGKAWLVMKDRSQVANEINIAFSRNRRLKQIAEANMR